MNFFRKIIKFLLPALVLGLLSIIPLYPKIPLVDIQNTWVYIRVEDFLVFFVLAVWMFLLARGKITLRTPLTVPILLFWIVGAIATIHGVVVIFPTISNVFPNVALLAYLRHIEYLSLFFVAYTAAREKKFVYATIITLVTTLLLVVAYGFGQKYLSFPAYLTMNEEYAKGIPIIISPLNRISSTFAGHYDLAAYLVLIIPIVVSLFFGVRNIFLKGILLISSLLGFVLLFMTVSRVSFFVLFIALFFVLLFNKRKIFLVFIPIVIILGAFFLLSSSSLLSRFGNTVSEVDVLVDAKTGGAIGQVKFFPRNYLFDKEMLSLKQEDIKDVVIPKEEIATLRKEGVPERLIPFRLPRQVAIVPAVITSTGETLPQGSGYINLSLSPVIKRLSGFFYEYPPSESSPSASIKTVYGDYLVKRASAYDLSFTTRFQGEWPHALEAFGRNLFLGSGYGSVSLAVDNNYYRMLGETGLVGTLSFIAIFIVFGIYMRKVLPEVKSPVVRSFVLGLAAGIIGLSLNAVLIDVFEASKVAFQLWLLVGVAVGVLSIHATKQFNIYKELLKALTSPYAIIVYLLFTTIIMFGVILNTYFIGDDFTWFRWAADCKFNGHACGSLPNTIWQYFSNSEGFFYRPGTKTYFLLMYPLFWLNQVVYHSVSIGLHFVVASLLYLLARKIFKNNLLAVLSAFLFLIISGYLEVVMWISSTGHLFNSVFIIASLLLFIKWDENRKVIYLILSIFSALVSLSFYEMGIITPFLALAYLLSKEGITVPRVKQLVTTRTFAILFVPNIIYLVARLFAHSHWFSGDYSYNLLKLPFNLVGNFFGYALITLFGPLSFPIYEKLRLLTKSNIPIAIIILIILGVSGYFIVIKLYKLFNIAERRYITFSLLFFAVCLIPFIGLGNISFRYSYLASFGIVMILAVILRKIYLHLESMGRDVAFVAIGTIISVFCIVHIIQSQQAMIEWKGAGEKVQNFLTSLDSLYADPWSSRELDTNLYFANVPIKNGNAWIFPVGLSDSIWFAFKNETLKIHTVGDINQVSKTEFDKPFTWVLEFQSDGSLKKMFLDENGKIQQDID